MMLVHLAPLAQEIFESKAAKAERISGAALPYACIVLMHLPKHLPLTTAGYRTHTSVDLCSNLLWLFFFCSHVSSVGFFIIFLKNENCFHGNNYASGMYEFSNVLRKHLHSVHRGQDVFMNIDL